jgi:hypothetical protein
MSLTQKPVSTISYNTEAFLIELLNRLKSGRIINYALWIRHQGEEDINYVTGEITKDKDHWHIYLDLAKRIELLDLKKEFNEIDINNSKPLGCMNFQSSKVGHWIGYAIHLYDYLIIYSPNELDKISYSLKDIKTIGLIEGELNRLYKQFTLPLVNTKEAILYEKHGGKSKTTRTLINALGTAQKAIAMKYLIQVEENYNRYEKLTVDEVKKLEEI